jgi:isopenicillin N synthase-like dioxygenase
MLRRLNSSNFSKKTFRISPFITWVKYDTSLIKYYIFRTLIHERLIMTNRKVPALSLRNFSDGTAAERQDFVSDLYSAFKEYGFVILENHCVDEDLLNKAYSLSKQLFSLPLDTKKQYYVPGGGGQRGYTPFGLEQAKDAKVSDLKEFWHIAREFESNSELLQKYPQNVWVKELAEFKEVFSKIYQELDKAGALILSALEQPLNVPSGYFADMIQDGNSILRLLHYPPIPAGTDPRCIRAAAHGDINLITLLVSATSAGLELLDKDGSWMPVQSNPNNIVVNIGDMLARITNDILPSTIHRVVNPADKNESRYSMPFFIHPKSEAVLSCLKSCRGDGPKYPDITADDFLQQRLRELKLK